MEDASVFVECKPDDMSATIPVLSGELQDLQLALGGGGMGDFLVG